MAAMLWPGRISWKKQHERSTTHIVGQTWLSEDWQARHSAPAYQADAYHMISVDYQRLLGNNVSFQAIGQIQIVDDHSGGSMLLGLSWHQSWSILPTKP